jgi:DNA polymerase
MDVFTLDFETYYSNEYTLKKLTTEHYVRDERFQAIGVGIKRNDGPSIFFPHGQVGQALRNAGLEQSMVVGHHMAFDGFILTHHYGVKPKMYVDTLSMARALGFDATVGGSLRKLSDWAITQGVPIKPKGFEVVNAINKRYGDFTFEELNAYGQYCKTDVDNTYALFQLFMQRYKFPADEMRLIDETMRLYCEPVLELDKPVLVAHLADVKARRQAFLDSIGATIESMRSDPKFAQYLIQLGVDPPTKVSIKTGKTKFAFAKTDEGLLSLLDHDDMNVVALVECRLGVKSSIEETRSERLISIESRGALPVPLKYCGAHTTRYSAWDKINLQNLPRGGQLRQALVAPNGYQVISADSSQIEARVVAVMAGQWDLVEAFALGRDVYSEFASLIFGHTVTKADKLERFVGKTCILGLGYGMGALRLQRTLKLGSGGVSSVMLLDECQAIVNLYRERYAAIPTFWKQCQGAIVEAVTGNQATILGIEPMLALFPTTLHHRHPCVPLPNGLYIHYRNLRERPKEEGWGVEYVYDSFDEGHREVKRLYGGKLTENIVQGYARVIVSDQWLAARAAWRTRFPDQPRRSPFVGQVHDELIACVPTEIAQETMQIIQTAMSAPPSWYPRVPVACEVGIADTYGNT